MKKIEEFIKEAHKGQLYGHKDKYEYHLLEVARRVETELLTTKTKLSPRLGYILGLAHDLFEDCAIGDEFFTLLNEEYMFFTLLHEEYIGFGLAHNILFELKRSKDDSYPEYIDNIKHPLAIVIKIEDLKFHLAQSDAKKRNDYDKYIFALKILNNRIEFINRHGV
jgi:hypothetical protein